MRKGTFLFSGHFEETGDRGGLNILVCLFYPDRRSLFRAIEMGSSSRSQMHTGLTMRKDVTWPL